MFERVHFDEWQAMITIVAFILCFSAFLFFCWRAIRMGKNERQHMSQLPFESEPETEKSSHE